MHVEHSPDARRFHVNLPEGLAYLSYSEPRPKVLDLEHTIVPDAAQGRGVGGALVRAAMEHAKAAGAHIVPTCPFVRQWLPDHPEFASLVAEGG